MAKRTKKIELSEDDKLKYAVTPTETAKYVNVALMMKPNKSAIMPGFIKNVINQGSFITYCIEHSSTISSDELNSLVDICKNRIEAVEVREKEEKAKEKKKMIDDIKARIENDMKALKMLEGE